jgi:hypothetical protein
VPAVERPTFEVRDSRSSHSMSGSSSSAGGVSIPVLDLSDSVVPYVRSASESVTVVVTPFAGIYASRYGTIPTLNHIESPLG